MPVKRFTTEQIIRKLRDELLNGEIFYTLLEAKALVERWRWEYNTVRPLSALGYRPPAPEAIERARQPAGSAPPAGWYPRRAKTNIEGGTTLRGRSHLDRTDSGPAGNAWLTDRVTSGR